MTTTMTRAVLLLVLSLAMSAVQGDIYMHNPRGSNNRNCRTDNNKERRNGNRLFDSQNNDNGGYSCPRAWPFACYKVIDDNNAFNQCQNQNANPNKNMLNEVGDLVNPEAVNTERMKYYSGSQLTIEWTSQHGMGSNAEVVSDVVIQYACEDTLEDNCGEALQPGQSPFEAGNGDKCTLRDGTPVRVADGNNGLNAEATNRIPDNANNQDDMRYGRHETYQYYQECKNRERNKGLWIADQDLDTDDARSTRQNPGATRYGLECAEEASYWPYWHYSPWKDVAVVTSDVAACQAKAAQSQNVVGKGRCDCRSTGQCTGNGNQPNNQAACEANGYTWVMDPAHGVDAPECVLGAYMRQNHLGNVGPTANSPGYNWTIPEVTAPQRCVLRVRYNMTSTDFNGVAINGDATLNGNNSPLKDNDENEEDGYVGIQGMSTKSKLHFAINTNQYARTFQTRSYVFDIVPQPAATKANCNKLYNLNMRGKRGNIVQAYPAVEYDFTPDHLVMEEDDCVHIQWTGTDYNPNRNGNNGEGGPYASNNQNKETKSDRHNMVQMSGPANNLPGMQSSGYNMFVGADTSTYKRFAFLDQPIDGNECWTFNQLQQEYDNRAEREESYHNCMKLSGVATPYFDGGIQKVALGDHEYMSTRNNNFSNRGQKGHIRVLPKGATPDINPIDGTITSPGSSGSGSGSAASDGSNMPVILGVLGGLVAAVGGFAVYKQRQNNQSTVPAGQKPPAGMQSNYPSPMGGAFNRMSTMFQSAWNRGGAPGAGGMAAYGGNPNGVVPGAPMVTASHDYSARESNELSFCRGDRIRVLGNAGSGWSQGENTRTGQRGMFPANYCN